MRKLSLLVAVLSLVLATSAFADVKPSLFGFGSYGGLNKVSVTVPIVNTTIETKGAIGFGGGGLLEFGGPKVGVEVGAAYYSLRIDAGGTVSSTKTLFVPGGLRFHFSPAVSLGVGGYFNYTLEDAADKSAYGLSGGLRFGGPFFIEPRFNYGLKDVGVFGKYKDIMVLVGWTFGKK